MANYLATDTDLTAVANAIRTKGGTSAQLTFPQGFVDAIAAISGGGGGSITGDQFFERFFSTDDFASDISRPVTDFKFGGAFGARSVYLPNVTGGSAYGAQFWMTAGSQTQYVVLPKVTDLSTGMFQGAPSLIGVDVSATYNFRMQAFRDCTSLNIVVCRRSTVASLLATSCFQNTPFAEGKAGGTLYVPSALIASYQAATNWSTILGYSTNSIEAIEGSQYEHYYVDGTPIT